MRHCSPLNKQWNDTDIPIGWPMAGHIFPNIVLHGNNDMLLMITFCKSLRLWNGNCYTPKRKLFLVGLRIDDNKKRSKVWKIMS